MMDTMAHPNARLSTLERFTIKYQIGAPPSCAPDLGACWLWIGTVDRKGYGVFHVGSSLDGSRTNVRAHRWSYENHVGPIPDGLTLDHVCRVRRCVRPSHLDPCSRGANVLRGDTLTAANVAKTHCPQGHPYDEANTSVIHGARRCLTCDRERSRVYRAANIDEVRRRDREGKRRKRLIADDRA